MTSACQGLRFKGAQMRAEGAKTLKLQKRNGRPMAPLFFSPSCLRFSEMFVLVTNNSHVRCIQMSHRCFIEMCWNVILVEITGYAVWNDTKCYVCWWVFHVQVLFEDIHLPSHILNGVETQRNAHDCGPRCSGHVMGWKVGTVDCNSINWSCIRMWINLIQLPLRRRASTCCDNPKRSTRCCVWVIYVLLLPILGYIGGGQCFLTVGCATKPVLEPQDWRADARMQAVIIGMLSNYNLQHVTCKIMQVCEHVFCIYILQTSIYLSILCW